MEIPNFKVGDAAFSPACDYMEKCSYTCSPNKENDETNSYTLNESFIMMNAEKILQKIRMLMKERFFYKKNELIHKINLPKPYPIVQIYAALTQLVEDTNEFIIDKYGRTGYLVNIGDYYLFQPSELMNPNISIFDRSVPIDFKNESIQFDMKRENIPLPLEIDVEVDECIHDKKESLLLKEMEDNFNLAVETARKGEKIPRGDENWYKHCGITMKKLIKEFNVPENDVLEFLVEHIVDVLLFDEKVEILNYLQNHQPTNSFEKLIKAYSDKKIIKGTNISGIILFSKDKRKIMILDEEKRKWVQAEPEDERLIAQEAIKSLGIKKEDFHSFVGFIGSDQKFNYLVFKIKDMTSKRNTGARCDESSKEKKIKILNDILGEKKYTKENTRGYVQADLCSLQEFLLRYYNKIKKNGKIWFLDYELGMLYKF
jgi:hypothetical protein